LPFTTINASPLIAGNEPVSIYYREWGSGFPLIFLHGGWGYEIYPFDRQIEAFKQSLRIIIPDRTAYGRSMHVDSIPPDFHHRAATETLSFLDAIGVERAILWGHSDGAVISVLMALQAAHRFQGIILEAFHYYRYKPASREFFETMARNPFKFGERITGILSNEHGEDYWQKLIVNNGLAWLKIADQSKHPKQDLYDGRFGEVSVPTLLIHGSRDPRTEPDELEAARAAHPQASIAIIEGAGHSPHSESASAKETIRVAREFLRSQK